MRSQPSSFQRKSKCHQDRRNSPSVASSRPTSSCLRTIFLISASSTARSRSAVISPCARLRRASFSGVLRSKLPTASARKGGRLSGMGTTPSLLHHQALLHSAAAASPLFRHTKVCREHVGARRQLGARAFKHDAPALQNYRPIREAQDLACLLLDHDRRQPFAASDLAQD